MISLSEHNYHFHQPNPHLNHPPNHSRSWKVKQRTYQESCIKFTYLTCATILTTSFIIECILIHLVILPCEHESGFIPTDCTYLESKLIMSSVKCENKCSKDRSTFQCVRISVTYSRDNQNYTASLFDNVATYQYYHALGCATSSCHRQNAVNRAWVQHFFQSIKTTNQFICYVHKEHSNEALLHKFYGPSTKFNTIFWPTILFTISVLTLFITWYFDRCNSWHKENIMIV